MKNFRKTLLLITLLILLVGIVNASEVSEDMADTDSITKEVVVKDTHIVSDMDAVPLDKKGKASLQTDQKYEQYVNESTTKTINKNKETTNLKGVSEIRKQISMSYFRKCSDS